MYIVTFVTVPVSRPADMLLRWQWLAFIPPNKKFFSHRLEIQPWHPVSGSELYT